MIALLKTSRLKKAFGGLQAIDALDLEVECDEILGIIGPNDRENTKNTKGKS
jgi:ABC-type branched-subunit amino acid transport system ATPase component